MQAFTSTDFDWNQTLEGESCSYGGLPPLTLAVVYDCVALSDEEASARLEIIKWLLQSGADPKRQMPTDFEPELWAESDHMSKESTNISVNFKGHSVISLAFAWIEQMRVGKGGADWTAAIKYLERVVALIATEASAKHPKVAVQKSVVDLWDSVREMSATCNATRMPSIVPQCPCLIRG